MVLAVIFQFIICPFIYIIFHLLKQQLKKKQVMTKPIHKLNGGNCATICHRCRKTIDIGFINELYCSKKCEMKTKLERIEAVIKYYYDRGTNKERVNEIKRKLIKDETTVSSKK